MDTLTHALSGALVGRVLAGRRAPAGGANGSAATSGAASGASSAARPTVPVWQMVAAGTVAATFPDLDFVLGWISELTYLRGRVRQRAEAGTDASEADVAVLETQLSAREPFEEEELACVVPIDTASAPDWRSLLPVLARLWPGAAAGEQMDTQQRGKQ